MAQPDDKKYLKKKNSFVSSKNITRKTLDVLYFHYGILKTENLKS